MGRPKGAAHLFALGGSVHWNEIDLLSAPVARPELAHVELDGETVVYDPTTGRAHVLNSAASVVWRLLDGSATLSELAGDVAAVYEQPADVIAADLVALGRSLGQTGLLAGVHGDIVAPPTSTDDCV